jgi:phospholipase C
LPTLVVSPFARGNPAKPRINSLLYDHTSVLKLIEWRWGLDPLTARDASDEVANLALALDLTQPDDSVPTLPSIAQPALGPCDYKKSDSMDPATGLPASDDSDAETGWQAAGDGADEEVNDFALLMKSDLMDGWPQPADAS